MLMQDSQGQSAGTTSQLFHCAVQSLSHVQLFSTPWTAARQASLSFTVTQSMLKPISGAIQSSHPLSSPSPPALSLSQHQRLFPMSRLFISGGQSIGALASASVFTMNIQDWFALGWTGLISLLSKGLSRVFSNTTAWNNQFFGFWPSLWSNSHIRTWLLEKP